jgi:lysozyme family protein
MSSNNFENCLKITLFYEGGFVNNPKDPGGATNKGITLQTLSHEFRRKATITELINISQQTLRDIYKLKYWNLIDGDFLPKGVDMLVFDISVNMGIGRATQFLFKAKMQAPNDVKKQIEILHNLRMGFWKGLATWVYFGKGWSNREIGVFQAALTMIK